MNTVAQTILAQLGGNKFLAMTGAKNLSAGPDKLYMHLPRGAKDGINHVEIVLEPSDTYTVKFRKVRGTRSEIIAERDMVYGDGLAQVFEIRTGLRVSL